MSLKDYEHWNEDAYYMWYHEEGKHSFEAEELEYDDNPYTPDEEEEYEEE